MELVDIILQMEVFILELGKMIYMMDMELRHGLIIVSIRDSLSKEKDIFLALFSLLMGVCIKGHFMIMRFKAREYLRKKMGKNILVIGYEIKLMGKARSYGPTDVYILEIM